MSEETVRTLITVILSGSVFGAVAALITSKATARKTHSEAKALDAKLPAEVDSVVVQGAESAVLLMRSALESAQARISQLEQEREADRKRIAELEAKVAGLEAKVQRAEAALADARTAGASLRKELEDFVAEQRRRR